MQQLNGCLASAEYLRTVARVRLVAIPSADKALRDVVTPVFVAPHLFSVGGRHPSAVVELLRLIENMEEIHTKVQGMISLPHPVTTLLYNMSRLWSLYLYSCVSASASEDLEAPGSNTPFTLEPILLELDSGCYVGPILPGILADLLAGRRPGGGDRSGGGGISSGGSGGIVIGGGGGNNGSRDGIGA